MKNIVLKEYQRHFQLLILHMLSYLNGFDNLSTENLILKMTKRSGRPSTVSSNENAEKLKVILEDNPHITQYSTNSEYYTGNNI